MSLVLTPVNIVELALQHCGTYSVHDTGADPDELNRGLLHLDIMVAQLVGTMRCWWLIPETVVVPLTADVNPTDIMAAAGNNVIPTDTLQFAVTANLRTTPTASLPEPTGDPLKMMTRDEYEGIGDPARSGNPAYAYIDRTVKHPMLYTYPVIGGSDHEILLSYQKYENNLTDKSKAHQFDVAWQRFLVRQLTYDIGSGPVTRLPSDELREHKREAEQAKSELAAFNAVEQKRFRQTLYRDF